MPTDSSPPAPTLAPTAEVTVRAGERRPVLDLGEVWQFRDLLYFLTRRHVLARYKQAVFGVLWAVIQPFMTMVVFSVFLGRLAGIPSDDIPYPVFAYLGILPWQLFSGTVSRCTASVVGNAHLIRQVYFPRVLIPVSTSLSALVDFAVAFVLLFLIMGYYGMAPAWSTLLVLPLVLLIAIIATGIGMGLAAWNVRFRDVSYVLPFLLQIWMFATPVVYPMSLVPERYRLLYAANPLTGLIEGIRDAVLGRPLDVSTLTVSVLSGLLLAGLGIWQFGRMERRFADVI